MTYIVIGGASAAFFFLVGLVMCLCYCRYSRRRRKEQRVKDRDRAAARAAEEAARRDAESRRAQPNAPLTQTLQRVAAREANPYPTYRPSSSSASYKAGEKVLVKRSTGEEVEATVHEYIGGEKDAYIVALDDGKTRKQVPAAEVRPYEPKPVEDPEADAAILLDIALDAAAAEASRKPKAKSPKVPMLPKVFARGTKVLVKRSNGEEIEATIYKYDNAKRSYWVTLPGQEKPKMLNPNAEVRAVEPTITPTIPSKPPPTIRPTIFAVGAKVLVKRSSGEEVLATVYKYDVDKQAYTVTLPGGMRKMCRPEELRPIESVAPPAWQERGSGTHRQAASPEAVPSSAMAEARRKQPSLDAAPNPPKNGAASDRKSSRMAEARRKSEAAFAVGTKVLVKRSDGEWTEATVFEYTASKNCYSVKLPNGSRKLVLPDNIRALPTEVEMTRARVAAMTDEERLAAAMKASMEEAARAMEAMEERNEVTTI